MTRKRASDRSENRKAAILDAAILEMNKKGMRGITMHQVAARLDLAAPAIVYYFRTKEGLAAAAFLRTIARYRTLIADAAAEPDPSSRINRLVGELIALRERAETGEAPPLTLFNDVRALNDPEVNQAYVAMFRGARSLLDAALERPQLNARTHLLLSELFWIPVWSRWFDPRDASRVAQRMASVLNNGVIAPSTVLPEPKLVRLVESGQEPSSPEAFLRAATELINEEGYHGASVERITARLKLTKGSFYHHHQTKDELVAACFTRTFELIWRAITEAEVVSATTLEVLVNVCASLLHHQLTGVAPLLRSSALTTIPEPIRSEMIERFNQVGHRLASIISDGVAESTLSPVDVNIAAQCILGALNAATELRHWAPSLEPHSATHAFVRPTLAGLHH